MSSAAEGAWYNFRPEGDAARLVVGGAWTRDAARRLDPLMRSLDAHGHARVEIDCTALSRLDTVGAWLLLRTKRKLERDGATVTGVNVGAEYRALVHTIDHECRAPPVEMPPPHTFAARLERIGRAAYHAVNRAHGLTGFFGLVVVEAAATLRHPRKLRVASLFHQMEEIGLNAVPIVGLLSLLIGVVFAYQGADQLHRFGADVFTVNLLSVGICASLAE